MPKIVVNSCFGGFGLSDAAVRRYAEIKGIKLVSVAGLLGYTEWYVDSVSEDNSFDDPERDDPILVQVIEELGDAANGNFAKLRIADVPDEVDWYIEEYDGIEHVAEKHRTW